MANVLVRTGLVAPCLVWFLMTQSALAGEPQSYVEPRSKAAEQTACVEPTDLMRRQHMELIKHQRDAVTHRGIRGTKHSLSGCIDCHVSRGPDNQPVAINDDRQFCNECHQFAAVNVNCFDCHASVPRGGPLSEAALAPQPAPQTGAAGAGPGTTSTGWPGRNP